MQLSLSPLDAYLSTTPTGGQTGGGSPILKSFRTMHGPPTPASALESDVGRPGSGPGGSAVPGEWRCMMLGQC
ncbi:hypothetical protein IEQ34_001848 [Dendrobium chrysotoxum]|uniref:Uncharacterized protein n=1 Tax=Dendrobium chrysotoxum TaxID=161865 RepID=A0AAV7HHU4_DENCH|nr:hypothetical protein IEQ34_001848 [Dendrobium chrysotoxum]